MSNIKTEIMSTLKKIMGFYEQEEKLSEQTKEQFRVYADSEIKVSDMKVGGKVELIDVDGNLSPAPDGDYELENGSKFTVKDSQIVSIEGQPADQPTDQTNADQASPDQPASAEPAVDPDAAQDAQDEERLSALEDAVAAMQGQLDSIMNQLGVAATKEEVNQFSKHLEELNTNIKTLAKIPVEFSKTSTNHQVKESREEKMIALAKILGANK